MISSLFLEPNSSFQTSVLYSQGFQHWFPFLVGTPWMRRRFFLFSVFRFSQAFIVPDLSRTGIRPTPKNPAGARILNSGEKEGYWRHHCLKHCFAIKFASSELSSTATKNQCASGCTLLRTLRNYDGDGDGDGDGNVKKSNRFLEQNNNSAHASRQPRSQVGITLCL